MRVFALSDSASPWHSFWIRFGQYAPNLALPVEISTHPSGISHLNQGDALLLYRFNSAWGDLEATLAAAAQRGVRILADVDDDLWQAPGWTNARLRLFSRALRHCQVISCSTTSLREVLSVMYRQAQVVVIPNSTPPGGRTSLKSEAGPLQLCWTGAPWTRPQDLDLLKPLAQWASRRAEPLRWRHIGHREGQLSFATALGLDPALVEVHPLQPHAQYLQSLNGDIGLAPLAPNRFNSFKSELKLLEYSGLAMPWIASDVMPYQELCSRWTWPGRLCRTATDWIRHVEELLDPATRCREGNALQQRAHQLQGHDQTIACWRTVLLSA